MRRWHKPISLSKLHAGRVPDTPGVFVLLEDEGNLASVLKISPARSLRRSFELELNPPAGYQPAYPSAMMFFETFSEVAEAERLLVEYKRRHGRNPALNSPY